MFVRKLALLLLTVTLSSSLWALPLKFQEGVDYDVISAQATGNKEVLEYFSYNCPHCYSFDPIIEGYLSQKPVGVQFRRIPVGFGREIWKMSARAYVLAKALGKEEELHAKIFSRVQVLNRPFRSEGDIKAFFLANGVTEGEFNKSLESFSAKTLTKANEAFMKKHPITSVPTVIVNGKYKVNISRVLDKEKLIQLVDFLTKFGT